MNKLQVALLTKIFRYTRSNNSLRSCRLVCKYFSSAVNVISTISTPTAGFITPINTTHLTFIILSPELLLLPSTLTHLNLFSMEIGSAVDLVLPNLVWLCCKEDIRFKNMRAQLPALKYLTLHYTGTLNTEELPDNIEHVAAVHCNFIGSRMPSSLKYLCCNKIANIQCFVGLNNLTDLLFSIERDDFDISKLELFPTSLNNLAIKCSKIFGECSLKFCGMKKLKIYCNTMEAVIREFPYQLSEFTLSAKVYSVDHGINNLPDSLTRLIIVGNYNYPLFDMPKNLKYIELGEEFDHPLDCLPDSVSVICFDNYDSKFNHPIYVLPRFLKTLKLRSNFNQPLTAQLPSLKVLEINGKFNHSIDALPDSIEKLTITGCFNQQIHKLPEQLKYLELPFNYDKPLPNTGANSNLIHLRGAVYRDDLPPLQTIRSRASASMPAKLHFSKELTNLTLLSCYDKEITDINASSLKYLFISNLKSFQPATVLNLETLVLDGGFNRPIDMFQTTLPNLKILILGNYFDQNVDALPNRLEQLTLGARFKQSVDKLPATLKILHTGMMFNQPINNLPALTKLELGHGYGYGYIQSGVGSLDAVPDTVEVLSIQCCKNIIWTKLPKALKLLNIAGIPGVEKFYDKLKMLMMTVDHPVKVNFIDACEFCLFCDCVCMQCQYVRAL